MTALENEAVFVVTNWVSEDTAKSWNSSRVVFSCSAIFLHCLKLGLLYTLSDEISAVWHLGTEVTGVAFVTWSPWHMWTIAPWIRFCFL